jgi:glycosyltransferase involved in cell wall biosynthesis
MDRLRLLQVPALMWGERRAIRAATTTFVCSKVDQRYLSRLMRSSRIKVVPNAVSIPDTTSTSDTEPLVLFIGTFGYAPNVLAADYLVEEIWPVIRAAVPTASLCIVGRRPEQLRSYGMNAPGVIFSGFVDDLGPVYRRARVVCCPITSGAGTRVKIVEAAAHGKAIVSTSLGAEGLDFEPPEEIVLADSTLAIASSCIELLQDPHRAAVMGAAAQKRSHAAYDVDETSRSLSAAFAASLAVRRRDASDTALEVF